MACEAQISTELFSTLKSLLKPSYAVITARFVGIFVIVDDVISTRKGSRLVLVPITLYRRWIRSSITLLVSCSPAVGPMPSVDGSAVVCPPDEEDRIFCSHSWSKSSVVRRVRDIIELGTAEGR